MTDSPKMVTRQAWNRTVVVRLYSNHSPDTAQVTITEEEARRLFHALADELNLSTPGACGELWQDDTSLRGCTLRACHPGPHMEKRS